MKVTEIDDEKSCNKLRKGVNLWSDRAALQVIKYTEKKQNKTLQSETGGMYGKTKLQ